MLLFGLAYWRSVNAYLTVLYLQNITAIKVLPGQMLYVSPKSSDCQERAVAG